MKNMNGIELIDRYLKAVADRLPESMREDVKNELKANIEDMLPDEPTDEDIRNVLERLGNPAILAGEYRQDKKYLIGPAMYDSYISVLKLVTGIAAIVFMFIGLIEMLTGAGDSSFTFEAGQVAGVIAGFITSMASAAVSGIFQAFFWVTVAFVIMERTGVGDGNPVMKKRKWSVDDLPRLAENPKGRISRSETVVGLIFSVIFAALLIFRPEVFGWYQRSESGLVTNTPVFNLVRLQSYIIVIILLAVVQFFISIYKFIAKRWNLPLAIANATNNIALSILIYVLLNDGAIINPGFLSRIADVLKMQVSAVTSDAEKFLTVFTVIFILSCAIDSVSGFVKSRSVQLPAVKL